MDLEKIEYHFKEILKAIGEDPEREGLLDTPKRVAKMYEEIFSGLNSDHDKILQVHFHDETYNEIILIRDIPFYSVCEHHFVPFFGMAHIGYIPNDGVITGLSKILRLVDSVAKQPQIQERLTTEVAEIMMRNLKPKGVIAVFEAEHLCISMRGIKKPESKTVTSVVRGIFQKDEKTRNEALKLILEHK
jgi:GTP cyclohydrolase I